MYMLCNKNNTNYFREIKVFLKSNSYCPLLKIWNLKPNILKEMGEENAITNEKIAEKPILDKFIEETDELVLEDAIGWALIGIRVITKYYNKTYAIDDISWDLNPEKTFPNNVSKIFYLRQNQRKLCLTIWNSSM